MPQDIIEDVIVQVGSFYYSVDFIVLDTQPIANENSQIQIILGRPFLATVNAQINCRNGLMRLTFSNMTVDVNIFSIFKQPDLEAEDENEIHKVSLIDSLV